MCCLCLSFIFTLVYINITHNNCNTILCGLETLTQTVKIAKPNSLTGFFFITYRNSLYIGLFLNVLFFKHECPFHSNSFIEEQDKKNLLFRRSFSLHLDLENEKEYALDLAKKEVYKIIN